MHEAIVRVAGSAGKGTLDLTEPSMVDAMGSGFSGGGGGMMTWGGGPLGSPWLWNALLFSWALAGLAALGLAVVLTIRLWPTHRRDPIFLASVPEERLEPEAPPRPEPPGGPPRPFL